MVQNPYKVLGVSPNATDEEIKKAYRELSKKYHPDLNPGDETAAKKMSDINAAYDQIQKGQTGQSYGSSGNGGGYSSSYGSTYGFGSFDDFFNSFNQSYGKSQSYQERGEYQAARNYIRNGMYKEAVNALSGVDIKERDGKWYYLHSMANYKMGNRVAALESAKQACAIEPDNEEYQRLLQAITQGSRYYDDYSVQYNSGSPFSIIPGNLCYYGLGALCLSSMCTGRGLPFIFCC